MAVEAERALAFSYAAAPARAALEAVFALDDVLANILRSTREPLVGQMRLTWWYAALIALDDAPPPAEPVLRALHAQVLPRGVSGAMLAGIIDAWEILLGQDALQAEAIATFAQRRGGVLFAAAACVLGIEDARIGPAGEGWAAADLAMRLTDRAAAGRARTLAEARLSVALRGRWPRAARSLGAMALLARFDIQADPPAPGSPVRVARLLWHRSTGI